MRTIKEIVCLMIGLFVLGIVGGLEKGLISIGGALIALAASAMVIGITIFIGRRSF